MNTRDKIISPAMLVIGTFDPMLAAHSERLADLKKDSGIKLVVAVADPPEPLLDCLARMELAAALRMVDFVMPYAEGLESASPWTAVHNDIALHAQWSADFKEHVRRRSQPA